MSTELNIPGRVCSTDEALLAVDDIVVEHSILGWAIRWSESDFSTLISKAVADRIIAEQERFMSSSEVREITQSDRAWPLLQSCSMEEHLANGERPFLSCAMTSGRAYRLTEAQRAIIREWFNMTCSPEVMVEMLATFPDEPTIVREVIIRSEQHVDPQNLRLLNGPRKVTIDKWGEFMSAVRVREIEMSQQRELDGFTARVAQVIKRAKDSVPRIVHGLKGPGEVAHQWHAAVIQATVEGKIEVSAEAQREMLRSILLSRGEHGLAKLVREPSILKKDDDETFAEVGEELDALLKQLSVK